MLEFEWETKTYDNGEKFIYWKATWDGRFDNDPLLEDDFALAEPEHPLKNTLDWNRHVGLMKESEETLTETGDIVVSNEVTIAICKMLSDNEAMKNVGGATHPYCYRNSLLVALAQLWD